ncbi:hypothetical protein CC78DRAFT_547331 [Lojkania enalia]|uniref:Uncharacterized protein n=1 Tax=Lojkania enalia TaxID=147567 RepID=A0A9P4K3M4_9PLEO|nr:hypothetical protein CC78DRAFT_547331 [Didymosphaeria enalia]
MPTTFMLSRQCLFYRCLPLILLYLYHVRYARLLVLQNLSQLGSRLRAPINADILDLYAPLAIFPNSSALSSTRNPLNSKSYSPNCTGKPGPTARNRKKSPSQPSPWSNPRKRVESSWPPVGNGSGKPACFLSNPQTNSSTTTAWLKLAAESRPRPTRSWHPLYLTPRLTELECHFANWPLDALDKVQMNLSDQTSLPPELTTLKEGIQVCVPLMITWRQPLPLLLLTAPTLPASEGSTSKATYSMAIPASTVLGGHVPVASTPPPARPAQGKASEPASQAISTVTVSRASHIAAPPPATTLGPDPKATLFAQLQADVPEVQHYVAEIAGNSPSGAAICCLYASH